MHWGSTFKKFPIMSSFQSLTYLLTPRNRVLPLKLSGSQQIKEFLSFYGTRMFITAFTNARHLFISWASSIQSIPLPPTSWKIHLNTILPSTSRSSQWSLYKSSHIIISVSQENCTFLIISQSKLETEGIVNANNGNSVCCPAFRILFIFISVNILDSGGRAV